MKIYWANSIFSDADRAFNSICIKRLRSLGYEVLCPQDKPFNDPRSTTRAAEIFREDTAMIRECDVFVACIDQETIDSGVACEIGVAWCWGKHIVGLYTDFRQFRRGGFKMYKNPYVIGCIEDRGDILTSLDMLLGKLDDLRANC